MSFQGLKGGLLALLFFISFSYADWDLELRKLVNQRDYAKALAQVSGAIAEKSYNLAKGGSIAGRLLSFTFQGLLWSGVLYLSTDLLHQYIDTKLSNSSTNPYNAPLSFCTYSIGCISVFSDEDSYVVTGFNGNSSDPGFVVSSGIPGAQYCYVNVDFYDTHSTFQRSFSGYVEDSFKFFLKQYLCPTRYFPGVQYETASDVINDPANYNDILNILKSSPVASSSSNDTPSVSVPLTRPYEIERQLSNGYTIIETVDPATGQSTFSVRTPSGAVVPATRVVNEIHFTDNNNKYAYNYQTNVITNITNNTTETETTKGTGTLTDSSTGQTLEIDFGTFESPAFPEVPKLDTSIDIPEKKSLTDLINSSFSSIPALNILKQLKIEGSGVCSFNIPVSFGGASSTGVLDFCQFSDIFSIIGSFILAFAHLFSVYIVFKGD